MPLDRTQIQILKSDIQADPVLSGVPRDQASAQQVADAYNSVPATDFWAWRTRVTEAEYVGSPGVDVAGAGAATVWSWPAFIARSAGEQAGWSRMFAPGWINPALANIRQGLADIFSGSQNNAPAQRNHLTVLSKRKATRAEKLFATGPGTFNVPATMSYEGLISYSDVMEAWNS
jgi:hypothetical protein